MNKVTVMSLLTVLLIGNGVTQANENVPPIKSGSFICYTHDDKSEYNIFIGYSPKAEKCASVLVESGISPIHSGEDILTHTNPMDCIKAVPFD